MSPWAVPALALAGGLLAAALVVLRRRYLLVTVTGLSMAPTLRHGDAVLVRRAGLRAVRRGQLVLLEPVGAGSGARLVKRVAALPGDPMPAVTWHPPAVLHVPPGHVVVLGDNPAVSLDSRRFGSVPGDRLVGVITRRLTGGPLRTPAAPARRDRPRHPPRAAAQPEEEHA
ncbi:S26 family signal peptidase [Dactylosporangium sp. CA-233914]|uniref:S26 family signal peptidase n=1 Tax=Dactylosporangium sp. CA-233914 TaxID=3239934 RepID=UPI003D9217AC